MSIRTSENIVFVDASALIGIFNKKDQYHLEAEKIYKKLKEKNLKLIISNYVAAEAHAVLLNKTKDTTKGLYLLETLHDKAEFRVIFVESDMENNAIESLKSYKDKLWSITDMLSFLIMQELNLKYYFSFDSDFRQHSTFVDIKGYLK